MVAITKTVEKEFARICAVLTDEQNSVIQLQPEVMQLKSLLMAASEFDDEQGLNIGEGETATGNGLAISAKHAAWCFDDYVRTITFIRGLKTAIDELLLKNSQQSIEVLYAGCGPFAILALPVLKVLAEKPVYFTLIDIHAESINSVKKILQAFNLTQRVRTVLCQDVMQYAPQEHYQADIIMAEVMQAALNKEPQVAVCCYLQRLFPQALLIPEAVHVDLIWVNPRYEYDPDCLDKPAHRKNLGRLFSLNEKQIKAWLADMDKPESAAQLAANRIAWPADLGTEGQLMFFTQLTVYKNHSILEYQSGLTCPLTANISGQLNTAEVIQFVYEMGATPGLHGQVIESPPT